MTPSCFEVRESDGYINATKLAQAAGKFWGHYNENAKHQVYLAKLAKELNIPLNQLVLSQRGGSRYKQGTWIHPQVATHFACWVSIDFSIRVLGWMEQAKKEVPRIALEYVTAMSNLTCDDGNTCMERIVRDALALKCNGKVEVECKHGFIDILTDDELIEVKHVSGYKHALGQVLAYSKSFPTRSLRIHLFGTEDELKPDLIELCESLCNEYNIRVTHECAIQA